MIVEPNDYSVCFAQTAALRREGRALSEKRKGHEGVDGDVYQVQVIHDAFPPVNYVYVSEQLSGFPGG